MNYRIGTISVSMSPRQAAAWNDGTITACQLSRAFAFVPVPVNDYRKITLRRAFNAKLEPEVCSLLEDTPAVPA